MIWIVGKSIELNGQFLQVYVKLPDGNETNQGR